MKHTPAPWDAHINSAGTFEIYTHGATIAMSNDTDIHEGNIMVSEAEANALLIASAPEMLSALRSVVNGIPEDCMDTHVLNLMDRVQGAINKATGGEV